MKLSEKMREKCGRAALKGLEIRLLKFMGRAALWALFLCYLAGCVPLFWRWLEIRAVRMQDLSGLEAVMEQGLAGRDMAWAEKWIAYRPLPESAEVMRRAAPYTGSFSPLLFLNFARRAQYLGDDGEKRFWVMLTRYRLRYDALRCGAPDSVDVMKSLLSGAEAASPGLMEELPPAEALPVAQRVLDFDARYPAHDDPRRLCDMLGGIGNGRYRQPPRATWDRIHFDLRLSTGLSLRAAAEAAKKKP